MKTKLFLILGLLFVPSLLLLAEPPEKEKPRAPDSPKHFDKEAMQHRLDELRKMRSDYFGKIGRHDEGHDAEKREKMEHMRAQIEELNRAGKHKEAEELKHKFADAMREEGKDGHPKIIPPEERLEHLNEAIKHLHAAGMHEPAENLEQAAKHMREELQARKHPGPRGGGSEIQELREQLEKLRHAVDELRGRLGKPPGETEVRKPEKP